MRVGFSFSPAGLLLPYHLGVLGALLEAGMINPATTPLVGSSAGAIAVASVGCGVDVPTAMAGTLRAAEYCRVNGARGKLLEALCRELDKVLPDDAHEKLNAANVSLCYTAVLPTPRGIVADEFSSYADLVQVLRASCNVPLYSTPFPVVWVRRNFGVDGFFAVDRSLFGCPETDADRTVRVSVFPRESIGLCAPPSDVICPALELGATSAQMKRLFDWALNPAPEEALKELFKQGRDDALSWMEQHGDGKRA